MTDTLSTARASTLWIVLLTAASTGGTLIFACATPFAPLAALAALHMRRRDGIVLMLLAWAASQAVGFGLLAYPHDARTVAWGAGLAAAAVGSLFGARAGLARLGTAAFPVRLLGAYVAAFVAFKLVILMWSVPLGGVAAALSPDIMLRQLVRNGAILLGLLALYHALVRIGVPALAAAPRAARAA